jgi:hypothetical protein
MENGGMPTTAKTDDVIRTAIQQRRLAKVTYLGRVRIIEPHDYGVQNRTVKLLTYQLTGASSGPLPNWRWMEVDSISEIELLDRTFRGGRPSPSGKHHTWDELYLRVAPPDDDN